MTPNAEVNAAAASFARAEFQVPVAVAWTPAGATPPTAIDAEVRPAFLGPVDLDAWDDRLKGGEAEWVQVQVRADDPSLLAALTRAAEGAPFLPALVVGEEGPRVVHGGRPARPGDVVHALLHRHAPTNGPLEDLLLGAAILDLEAPTTLTDLLHVVGEELASRLGAEPHALAARLADHSRTTAIGCLAVTRVTVPGERRLALAAARARPGVVLPAESPRVFGALVVVGSEDRRADLVRAVADVARLVVSDDELEPRWLAAPTRAELREVLLHAAAPPAAGLPAPAPSTPAPGAGAGEPGVEADSLPP
jgi:hypothetical protein